MNTKKEYTIWIENHNDLLDSSGKTIGTTIRIFDGEVEKEFSPNTNSWLTAVMIIGVDNEIPVVKGDVGFHLLKELIDTNTILDEYFVYSDNNLAAQMKHIVSKTQARRVKNLQELIDANSKNTTKFYDAALNKIETCAKSELSAVALIDLIEKINCASSFKTVCEKTLRQLLIKDGFKIINGRVWWD